MIGRILFPASFILACSAAAQTLDGGYIFRRNCAACHFPGNTTRAPLPEVLALQRREKLLETLETGSMKEQAAKLSAAEKAAVINYLVAPAVMPQPPSMTSKCAAAPTAFGPIAG